MRGQTRKLQAVFEKKLFQIILVCLAAGLISYVLGPSRYSQRILLLVLLWASITGGFNIISGYGGQIVFGYMMFVGTGAYTTILLFKLLSVTPWLGMWIGALLAGLIAIVIGLPTLRLRGAYFAVATVAFPLMTFPVLNYLDFEEVTIPFTGHGAASMQFTDLRVYVLIGIILLGIILFLTQKLERSRFGYALKALKQNETAAEGMGIDTFGIKMKAFIISAAIGAIAGTIYSFSCLYVLTTHAVFGVFIIVRILSINIVGGMGTLWGPLVAAVILVPAGELLSSQFGEQLPGIQDVVYGAALVAAVLFMPDGIVKWLQKCFSRSWTGFRAVDNGKAAADNTVAGPGQNIRGEGSSARMRGQTILSIEGVSLSFGGVTALRDVSMEIPQGTVVGIIGSNGAGKTTLFNVINGYLAPQKGRIRFEGKDVTGLKPHVICRRGIGRTFQVAQVFTGMTVLENIMMGAFACYGDTRRAYGVAEQIAGRLGLAARANGPAAGLSMWETKMLEFSRALAIEPKLLLVDEPMAGLNLEETERIGLLIKEIAATGVTVVTIEHVVQSLMKIADIMIGLDEGKKVAEGTPQEVTSNPYIIESYLGSKWKDRYAKD